MPPAPRSRLVRLDLLTPAQVRACLDGYPSALANKTTSSSKGKETLSELDAWYHSLSLSSGLNSKDDLTRLMRWKLSREKHRPTLLALIASNNPSTCAEVLKRASALLSSSKLSLERSSPQELLTSVEAAMKILTELRGVGPATSSAIVAAWAEWGIFQSDELVQNLHGTGTKIDYTMGFYRKFYLQAVEVLKKLNKEGSVNSGREMERVAWGMFYNSELALEARGKGEAKGVESDEVKVMKGDGEEKKEVKKETPKRKANRASNEVEHIIQGEEAGRRASKRIRTKT